MQGQVLTVLHTIYPDDAGEGTDVDPGSGRIVGIEVIRLIGTIIGTE